MTVMDEAETLRRLEARVGRFYTRQRLGIEKDHEAQVFGQGLNFFHIENFTPSHFAIEWTLRLCGLYWRGRRNSANVRVRTNVIESPCIPPSFDGFTLLQLSDLHADMNEEALDRTSALVRDLSYDVCVLTGDFRGKTWGPYQTSIEIIARLRDNLREPLFAVLGNHDTIQMVPELEDIGIRFLMNEHEVIRRGSERIHIAGVDDAHFYRMDNIEKAALSIPHDEFSILLSHTPEIYRQARHANFNAMLTGHTHGGQICLPGQIPITLDSTLPRRFGSGAWRFGDMHGYTAVGTGSSVVPVRFNCPPEVTLHRLKRIGSMRPVP
jgi:predicted MPP superfamily phosphohydrolase